MGLNVDLNIDYLECSCYSPEHRLVFVYDEEENEIYVSVFLSQYRNFFKRIWIGIKYVFGYKCRFGHFDEFILSLDDKEKLTKIVNQLKTKTK